MKKILALILALVLCLGLVACGGGSDAKDTGDAAPVDGGTVKIICPYGVGGIADLTARKYAEVANKVQSDYTFIVENLTGGDGFAASTFFTEEDPSTMDLLVCGYGVAYRHDGGKKYGTEEVDFEYEKLEPFCTIDDRTWIVYAAPGTTLEDVIAKAKADGVKMSGGNPLSDPHLALGVLMNAEGGKVQVVPYDGGAEQKKGLIDGEVDVFVGGALAGAADVEAGTIVPILAIGEGTFEGFTGPEGPISVPGVAGEGMHSALNPANDYTVCILPAGGGLATHQGCDAGFREDMIEIAKLVWADAGYADWIVSSAVLLNHFEKYGDDAMAFFSEAREKGAAAYALLLG